MSISPDGWLIGVTRRPGPEFKTYDTVNLGEGIVWHSMEGWWDGSMRELDRPERQASWMFSISLDGSLAQHYPITASCWASGNGLANTHWWSVETEGLFSMPLNEVQVKTARWLIGEWAAWKGKPVSREGDLYTKSMWEHREVDTLITPNGGDTACPSERYQPLWAALAGEEDMDEAKVNELINARLRALNIIDEAGTVSDGTLARLDDWVEEMKAELLAAIAERAVALKVGQRLVLVVEEVA